MLFSVEFWLSMAALLFGIGVVWCTFIFGRNLYDRFCRIPVHLLEEAAHAADPQKPLILRNIVEECLERRNKFWELFGQVALSVVVSVLLTVLLLTKSIEPDAGLPILSAIVAFVVGKGIGGPRVGPPAPPGDS